MGSTEQERTWALAHGGYSEWLNKETNPTTVSLTYEYLIANTEVTVAQYRQFVKSTGYKADAYRGNLPLTWDNSKKGWRREKGRTWENPTIEQGDQHPVVCLTWSDANAFCEWLTKKERSIGLIGTNQQYRLPTEAEWQYACLGTSNTYYAWGNDPSNALLHANVIDATPQPDGSVSEVPHYPWLDGYFFTAPVASFKPTQHGLFDVHGNAWEWCHNWYYPYPGGKETDPMGPAIGKQRVMRGGSWDNYTATFRANSRRVVRSNFSSDTTGFRIVLVSEF